MYHGPWGHTHGKSGDLWQQGVVCFRVSWAPFASVGGRFYN